MKTNKTFFINSVAMIMAVFSAFVICDYANAAPRTAIRGTAAAARKSVATTKPVETQTVQETLTETTETVETVEKIDPVVINKTGQFNATVADAGGNMNDTSFADAIRKQRASIAANEAKDSVAKKQKNALNAGKNACDSGLRECMIEKCGDDFTKCATDGDTIFGEKLNACNRDANCKANEFKLFSAEIKSDRDMNVKLASYRGVINCGNQYNKCMETECGITYSKCLGKPNADAAMKKCETIANKCKENDSGLSSRFSTAIGKLRENAEKEIKADEEKLYNLRGLMKTQCEHLGAAFDERSLDCVFTVNFFAGNATTPTASRKLYAGDSFTCMQEFFGTNVTTFKENAYRETRAQTAASSAMFGSGVGTAVGLVTSGAIGRAVETQKAKKELNDEKKSQGIDKKSKKRGGKDDQNNNSDDSKPGDETQSSGDTQTSPQTSTTNQGQQFVNYQAEQKRKQDEENKKYSAVKDFRNEKVPDLPITTQLNDPIKMQSKINELKNWNPALKK